MYVVVLSFCKSPWVLRVWQLCMLHHKSLWQLLSLGTRNCKLHFVRAHGHLTLWDTMVAQRTVSCVGGDVFMQPTFHVVVRLPVDHTHSHSHTHTTHTHHTHSHSHTHTHTHTHTPHTPHTHTDLLRTLLCGGQPLQDVPHLHGEGD